MIAAFGPHTPRIHTHQLTVMDPNTMYGITKVTGELLCNYYFVKYALDVRCLRYPGISSWKMHRSLAGTHRAIKQLTTVHSTCHV